MSCCLLYICIVQLAHQLDYFMRLSTSIESQASGAVRGTKEANKIVLEAEKRASEVKHEVLQVNRAWIRAVMEAKCLSKILKEVEEWLASKFTQSLHYSSWGDEGVSQAQIALQESNKRWLVSG